MKHTVRWIEFHYPPNDPIRCKGQNGKDPIWNTAYHLLQAIGTPVNLTVSYRFEEEAEEDDNE